MELRRQEAPGAPRHWIRSRWRCRISSPTSINPFDQIWLSPTLAHRQTAAWIERRTTLGGDGSDHDPAWVELEF